jgi:branched-chain amino acid transport system substrate-binding protein
VIGYAFPSYGEISVLLARDEVAEHADTDRARIDIVFDSIGTQELTDMEIDRAQRTIAIPGLIAVVGHGGSRGSLAAAPVYNEAKVPHLVPLSTSRLLRTAGPWTFMLPPDDSIEGEFIGAFVAARGQGQRVTLFYVNDEYGVGLRDGITAALMARGVSIIDRVPVQVTSDFPTLVDASLARGVPDLVVLGGRAPETSAIASILWQRGHRIPIVAGDGAFQLPLLVDRAGAAADSIYVVAFWTPDASDSLSRAFVERYRRITGGEPTSSAAMSHDALMLTVQAIRSAGPDREAIRKYFLSLGRARPPYRGITGPISFLPGRPARLKMVRLSEDRPIVVASTDDSL